MCLVDFLATQNEAEDYNAFLGRYQGRLPFRAAAVTGATGFVGSHLIKLLRRGKVLVRALVRKPLSSRTIPGVVHVQGDVRDASAVRELVADTDVIFHTAAVVRPWTRNPRDQYDIGTTGTACILDAAREGSISVVCTSSVMVYNPYPPPWPVRTLDANSYVRAKHVAQRMVRRARESGLRASTVAPSGIIGPGDGRPTAIGQIILDAMAGHVPPLTFLGGIHLIDIRDVVEAHVLAALADPDDYCLPGELWTLNRLFKALSPRSRQCRVPGAVAFGGAIFMTGWARISQRPPQITPAWVHYFREALSVRYRSDSDRLGLSERSVARAIVDAMEWYRAWPRS
jgi:dihydroflavonol-4-reductase